MINLFIVLRNMYIHILLLSYCLYIYIQIFNIWDSVKSNGGWVKLWWFLYDFVMMNFIQYSFQIRINIIVMSDMSLSYVWVAVISRLIWTLKLLLNDYHNEYKHYPIINDRNELSMIPSLFHILWLLWYF